MILQRYRIFEIEYIITVNTIDILIKLSYAAYKHRTEIIYVYILYTFTTHDHQFRNKMGIFKIKIYDYTIYLNYIYAVQLEKFNSFNIQYI